MDATLQKCLPTYRIVRKIGSGIYGSVYHVRDALKDRAVKVVPIQVERSLECRDAADLDSRVSQDFHAVREYYERIKGDGVVDIHDFHLVDRRVTDQDARACLVILMELCPANLQDYVVDHYPLEGERLLAMISFLARTLERLTDSLPNVYLLSDLKPSNLLMDNKGLPVIGDLGGLKRLSSQSTASNAQFTPNWSAPELILRGSRPDMRSMIFSFGLVAYFLWEGRLPYHDSDFSERVHRIKDDGLQFFRDDMPLHVAELIIHCTAFDPADRPDGFGEILRQLLAGDDPPAPVRAATRVPEATVPAPPAEETGRTPPRSAGDGSRPARPPATPATIRTWTEPGVGMAFVWIGCSGSGWQEDEIRDGGFWIGRYPVTRKEWSVVMGTDPSHFRGGLDHPVEQISWSEALSFTRRLTGKSGGAHIFDLPSRRQWMAAAGNEVPSDRLAWHRQNSHFSTHPVGRKMPTATGLYDLFGNVMEWCRDPWGEEAARGENALMHVATGGSWHHDLADCAPRAGKGVLAGIRYSYLGFRLVCRKRRPEGRSQW